MGIFVVLAIIIFVPLCVVLTLVILLQDSKGEGLSSSAFGGAEIQSVLGGHGAATFLSKLTTWVAVGFMVISLFLMRFYGERTGFDQIKSETEDAQQTEDNGEVGEVVEDTADEDPKGTITTKQEANDDTPQEAPEEDTKGGIAPTEETE